MTGFFTDRNPKSLSVISKMHLNLVPSKSRDFQIAFEIDRPTEGQFSGGENKRKLGYKRQPQIGRAHV